MILSTIFTGAIAIFGLVGGSVGKVEEVIGCDSKYSGVLDAWNYIDTYLIKVDSNYCTNDCPCYFNDPTVFQNDENASKYFDLWVSGDDLSATAFQSCSSAVQTTVLEEFQRAEGAEETNGFKQENFADYWKLIEEKFECSGWCTTQYTKQFDGVDKKLEMYKYMFSDLGRFFLFNIFILIYRGVPKNVGCLKQITDWLPAFLNAFGAIAIVITVLEAVVFALAISLCCSKDKKEVSAKI